MILANTIKPACVAIKKRAAAQSENVFKELMARFNLNYHPGYDIKELEKQPLVDNPDIVLTKQAIQALKNEAVRLDKEILYAEALLPPNAGKKLQDDLTKLRTKREVAKEEAIAFEQKLVQLPDKVSIADLLHGKQMSRCDLEKKKLYDIMQMMAYHSREPMATIFSWIPPIPTHHANKLATWSGRFFRLMSFLNPGSIIPVSNSLLSSLQVGTYAAISANNSSKVALPLRRIFIYS